MIRTIDTYQTTAEHFRKNFVLNYAELSPLGKTILDGADVVRFNGQFIDVYKGSTRVYQFGFSKYGKNDWYGREGYGLNG